MNAIGGVHRFDGGPVERAVAGRLNGAAQLLFPGRRNCWCGGSIVLACASIPVDGRPGGADLMADDRRRCTIAFDGRLDNRTELVDGLRRYGAEAGSRDVDLALAAYEAWGDDCASKLVGDFAFGLWDGVRRRLLCVRDPLGVRPLYLTVLNGLLCFASQLRQVLAALRRIPPFDLDFVADRLAHGVDRADADCTPYRGVSRLKPGHRLIAENGRVRIERYWEWRVRPRASARHREYVEEFRETFSEAVESRMRGAGTVWSDLSGGLDSSSIVSAAVRVRSRSRLRAVSVVFNESTWSDEREWAVGVARAHGVEQHCIDGDGHHPFGRLREAVTFWEEPHAAAAFFGVHRQYGRLLAGAGVPILLTGIGAEAVVMDKHHGPLHLADLLRDRRFAALRRELDRWQRVLRMPLSNLLWRYCLRPLVSPALVSHDWTPDTHDWIDRSFARRWDLNARAGRAGMPSACRDVADRWHVEAIGRSTGFLLRGYLEKACDIRYPFLHRPLVELALATPWSLKAVPGESKALLRRAMRGVLPEEIRRRAQDVSTGHAVYAGLRREWRVLDQVVASSLLVELGIVNRERLRNALELARQGHAPNPGWTALDVDAGCMAAVRRARERRLAARFGSLKDG